jgi:hypothetical protein
MLQRETLGIPGPRPSVMVGVVGFALAFEMILVGLVGLAV